MLNALRHVWRHPLDANGRLSGIGRFARWQIATRLLPGATVAIPFPDRPRLLVSRGMYGATQNVYCGLNDFEDMSFLVHYLRQDDVFGCRGTHWRLHGARRCSSGCENLRI